MGTETQAKKLRVLFISDNPAHMQWAQLFAKDNSNIGSNETCASLAAAREKIRVAIGKNQKFDAVILDPETPINDGWVGSRDQRRDELAAMMELYGIGNNAPKVVMFSASKKDEIQGVTFGASRNNSEINQMLTYISIGMQRMPRPEGAHSIVSLFQRGRAG